MNFCVKRNRFISAMAGAKTVYMQLLLGTRMPAGTACGA
jgi:hypothetical protein